MESRQTVRKAAMNAQGMYDYQKLIYLREGFLNCSLEEEREEVILHYELEHHAPFFEIREESRQSRLAALIDAAGLIKNREKFVFSMNPENLFYDINHRVYIMFRDVYQAGGILDTEEFITEYKALIGFCMQKKYSFEDYQKGGESLYKKNPFLKSLCELMTLDEIVAYLRNEYETIVEDTRQNKVLVSKSWFQKSRFYVASLLFLIVAGGAYMGYQNYWMIPYQKAVIQAEERYMESDYIGVIDALEPVALSRLNIYQKYVLSVAYIKAENLTEKQKANILGSISLTGSEKVMEYWIHIGRIEVKEAQDIALLMSDDQLLLYGYLKEKAVVEGDTQLTGEEKVSAISDLDKKIQPLAEKYKDEEVNYE